MIELDQIVREISKKTKIDTQTVEAVCKHVFSYTVDVMKNEDDCRDILFNELFKFKLKRRFKDNKRKEYSAK